MFPDKKLTHNLWGDMMGSYMTGEDSYYSGAMLNNDAALDYAMDVLSRHINEEKPKVVRHKRSIHLKKGGACPVCDNAIRQSASRSQYTNECNKCGLTESSTEMGARHELTLEEFKWVYGQGASDEVVEKQAEEEQVVIALYRKMWSGIELTEMEDAQLDAILQAQQQTVLV